MKKFLLAAATVTISLMSAAPMVMAQPARPSDASRGDACAPGQKPCTRSLTQDREGKAPGARPGDRGAQPGHGPQQGDSRDNGPRGPGDQQARNQNGPKGHNQLAQNQQGQQQKGQKHQAQNSGKKSAKAPKVGSNGRDGKPFQRSSGSRFSAPPKGQEYRVVNDHLVLVNKDTLKIVTVVGLLGTLLN